MCVCVCVCARACVRARTARVSACLYHVCVSVFVRMYTRVCVYHVRMSLCLFACVFGCLFLELTPLSATKNLYFLFGVPAENCLEKMFL